MRASLVVSLAAAVAVALTSGCSRPAVALKPPAFQQQADSLRDWQAVAKQIAADMLRDGFLPDPARPDAVHARQPYYVTIDTPGSTFLHEVAQSLKAAILAHGGSIAATHQGAAVITLDVDVVQWQPRHRLPDGLGTQLGLAGGTAVVLGNQAPLAPAAGFGLLAGAGVIGDLLRTMTPTTNAEIAWGASIAEHNRLVFDVRYPMYIHRNDVSLYVPPPRPRLVQLRYAQ